MTDTPDTSDNMSDDPDTPNIYQIFSVGWAPRVALDFAFRRFCQGLKERPTKKPILLFLPKGGPVSLLAAFLGLFSDGSHPTVVLIEDEELAIAIDDTPMPDRVQKTTRVVVGGGLL